MADLWGGNSCAEALSPEHALLTLALSPHPAVAVFGDELLELIHRNSIFHTWLSTYPPFCRLVQCPPAPGAAAGRSLWPYQTRYMPSQGWITQSQKVWVGKNLRDLLVQTLCHGQGPLPLNSGSSSTANTQHINQH